jgi:hypothetical protein
VIVLEESKKRGQWRTGIAEKSVVGRNGVVRRAKVRTKERKVKEREGKGRKVKDENEKEVRRTGRVKTAVAIDVEWKNILMLIPD